jgi:hypothetical protein
MPCSAACLRPFASTTAQRVTNDTSSKWYKPNQNLAQFFKGPWNIASLIRQPILYKDKCHVVQHAYDSLLRQQHKELQMTHKANGTTKLKFAPVF